MPKTQPDEFKKKKKEKNSVLLWLLFAILSEAEVTSYMKESSEPTSSLDMAES